MYLYEQAVSVAALRNTKARQWRDGRRDIFRRLEAAIQPNERIVWVHAASLGEFEQGRPIIEALKQQHNDIKILLTFFSPSGYEIRKKYAGADYIFYLPIDRASYARRFLDIVQPEAAIFIKYEFWLNYLGELRRRNIATYVVSAIFRPDSVFFRPWGGAWRKALGTFDKLFVQNDESRELLASIGYTNVVVAGDTRFDRVAAIAKSAKRIDVIERFKGDDRLFVAGSTWAPDEELLIELANDNPTIRFVIAPHEMDAARIEHLISAIKGGAVRYTHIDDSTDLRSAQVLILDTVGILSSVYGYATWSYIGGGFGVGIHNTLEAATFGLPIAFGPNYHKFKEARDMIALGAACSVSSSTELKAWFEPLRDNDEHLQATGSAAREYTAKNLGATELILKGMGYGTK